MIMSCHTRLDSQEDQFTRWSGDSGLAAFKARFPQASSVSGAFNAALNALEDYCTALYDARKYAWTKLIAIEKITGKGTLYDWIGDAEKDLRAFSTGDLKTVHRCVTEAK